MRMSQAKLATLEAEINSLLDSLYADDKRSRMISTNVEKLALMLQKASLNRMSDELRSRVLNHTYIDSYMKALMRPTDAAK